ncbi:MAG: GNAT family N-acetyltransferase [Nakamurella sp.]
MIRLRDLLATDVQLRARATLDNVNWSGPRFTADQVRDDPALAHYWAGPPGPLDLGLVAEEAAGGGGCPGAAAVGVAWLRHFAAADRGYGFVDSSVPELSIWVRADHRGRGLGGRLLTALLDAARDAGLPGVSLSVEAGNPARRLYERSGFSHAGIDRDGAAYESGTLLRMF